MWLTVCAVFVFDRRARFCFVFISFFFLPFIRKSLSFFRVFCCYRSLVRPSGRSRATFCFSLYEARTNMCPHAAATLAYNEL